MTEELIDTPIQSLQCTRGDMAREDLNADDSFANDDGLIRSYLNNQLERLQTIQSFLIDF